MAGSLGASDGDFKMVAASTLYGSKPQAESFTSSGTWTRPTGVERVRYLLVGAGGGGSLNGSAACGAGGGGEVVRGEMIVTTDLTITIGAGGLGATTDPAAGNDGNNSTLAGGDITVTAYKGKAGLVATGGDGGGRDDLDTGSSVTGGTGGAVPLGIGRKGRPLRRCARGN